MVYRFPQRCEENHLSRPRYVGYRPVVPGGAGGAATNQEGQIMPTTLILAPPDFQTFLRPWASGCQLDDCEFQSGINFNNLKG